MFPIRLVVIALILIIGSQAFGQVSPPGLDDTNSAFWVALGLNQKLGQRWSSTSYIGEGRESGPDNGRILSKQAILVLNQELQFSISSFWAVSSCVSYRVLNRYQHVSPFDPDVPAVKDEIRYYARLYARPAIGNSQLSFSFRPEYRTYNYHGTVWKPIDKEVRLRFKAQASIPLGTNDTNHLIVADEILGATGHVTDAQYHSWTSLRYTENRFSTFYRHVFKHPSLVADLGVMQQIRSDGQYIAHVAVDFILVNPFGAHRQSGP